MMLVVTMSRITLAVMVVMKMAMTKVVMNTTMIMVMTTLLMVITMLMHDRPGGRNGLVGHALPEQWQQASPPQGGTP